ncbi:MAG: sensor histidine kinase [Deltaproteobacteria bacterium]|nr:sensor histidine kinase [Deltaproteobacteria bacterium]
MSRSGVNKKKGWATGLGVGLVVWASLACGRDPSPVMTLRGEAQPQGFTGGVAYLVDEGENVTITQASSKAMEDRFIPFDGSAPNFGANDKPYWLRLRLDNQTPQGEWWLLVGFPQLGHVNLFSPDGQGGWKVIRSGNQHPMKDRPIQTRHILFPLALNVPGTYYLWVQSQTPLLIPLKLYPGKSYQTIIQQEALTYGIFAGFILVVGLYSLMVFFVVRARVLLYYGGYVLANGLFYLSGEGVLYEVLWSDSPQWNNHFMFFVGYSALVLFLLFAYRLLDIPNNLPRWGRVYQGYVAVGGVLAVLSLVLNPYLLTVLALIYAPPVFVLNFLAGVKSIKNGLTTAPMFVTAIALYVAGSLVMTITFAGLAPVNFFTIHLPEVGAILEILLLAAAVGIYFNQVRKGREDAIKLAAVNIRESILTKRENQVLQDEITRREAAEANMKEAVHQAQHARETAEAATALKDKFVSLVAHDVRAPLSNILGVMSFLGRDPDFPLSPDEKDIITLVNKQSDYCLKMVEGLLNLEQLQKGAITPKMQYFQAKEMVRQVFFLKTQSDEKQVTLENRVPEGLILYGDRKLLAQVMQNLINNAIKFTPAGGSVRVAASEKQTDCLTVTDTGVGINPESLPNLFRQEIRTTTQGTAGEVGFGLGLPISWEIMQAMGGQLWAESSQRPGKSGTTFCVQLPPLPDDKGAVTDLADKPT